MKITFVSDIACPWCAVGLASLQTALARLTELGAELHFEPFELNPRMPPEGEDLAAHLGAKYGIDAQQIARNQEAIRQRGTAVGFAFGARTHIWNTFDAHRLLHWAALEGGDAPARLKRALLDAYHGRGENPGERAVLLRAAAEAGLDTARAAEVIDSGAYAGEVRAAEDRWQQAGITSVPSVIVNDRHLIQGGHPPEVFEQALRQIAAEAAAAHPPG